MTELESQTVFKKLTLLNYFSYILSCFLIQCCQTGENAQNTKTQSDESFFHGCYMRRGFTLLCVCTCFIRYVAHVGGIMLDCFFVMF